MKVKVFKKKQSGGYEVGFTIGVQTFHLNMGSDGIRPKEEAEWHLKALKYALKNLVENASEEIILKFK